MRPAARRARRGAPVTYAEPAASGSGEEEGEAASDGGGASDFAAASSSSSSEEEEEEEEEGGAEGSDGSDDEDDFKPRREARARAAPAAAARRPARAAAGKVATYNEDALEAAALSDSESEEEEESDGGAAPARRAAARPAARGRNVVRNSSSDEEESSKEEGSGSEEEGAAAGSGNDGASSDDGGSDAEEPDLTRVERVLAARDGPAGAPELRVKLRGRPFRAAFWARRDAVLAAGRAGLVRAFDKKAAAGELDPFGDLGADGAHPDWLRVERVIAERPGRGGAARLLVKWRGLEYGVATWEAEGALVGAEDAAAVAAFRARVPAREAEYAAAAAAAAAGGALDHASVPAFESGRALRPYQLESLKWMAEHRFPRGGDPLNCILGASLVLYLRCQMLAADPRLSLQFSPVPNRRPPARRRRDGPRQDCAEHRGARVPAPVRRLRGPLPRHRAAHDARPLGARGRHLDDDGRGRLLRRRRRPRGPAQARPLAPARGRRRAAPSPARAPRLVRGRPPRRTALPVGRVAERRDRRGCVGSGLF